MLAPCAIWAVIVGGNLLSQPPQAAIDARYLSAAWRLWSGNADAATLAELGAQPPLLAALMQAGWQLFGVSEFWARAVAPLFALGALLAIRPIARQLWPQRAEIAEAAPIFLIGLGGFAWLLGLAVPDWPLAFFALIALGGLTIAAQGRRRGWLLVGIGLGFGLLSKGAIALPLTLLPALLAPALLRHRPALGFWYLHAILATLLGLAIALPWILANGGDLGALIASHHGSGYAADLGPRRPWYWLILLFPFLVYPWCWWKPLLHAFNRQRRMPIDDGYRLCGLALASAILCGLASEGRLAFGLLPAAAPLALILARLLSVHDNRPKDYHAALPALPVMLGGLIFFLLNIVPLAHLDALWRDFIAPAGLPIWLGGTGLLAGLLLLGGGYLIGQAIPTALSARLIQLALFPAVVTLAINIEFRHSLRPFFDLTPVAEAIRAYQDQGREVAIFGAYRGEYDLPGRLEQPLTPILEIAAARQWAAAHPEGIVVSYFQGSALRLPAEALWLGAAGDHWVAFWAAPTALAQEGAALAPRF